MHGQSAPWRAACAHSAGPIVVIGRPRSGTRLAARLLLQAGVFMGRDQSAGYLDSLGWFLRFVAPLVTSAWYPHWPRLEHDTQFAAACESCLAGAAESFFEAGVPQGAWGWKFPETLFLMPVIKQIFPQARFVHVIRDGRDVCLSKNGFFQLTGPQDDFRGWNARGPAPLAAAPDYRAYCLAVMFGQSAMRSWQGIDLADPEQLMRHRFLLQMQAWVFSVTTARGFGASLGGDYIEIRYEDMCARPDDTFRHLCSRLNLPCEADIAAPHWAFAKPPGWRHRRLTLREARDFDQALSHGTALLCELGYDTNPRRALSSPSPVGSPG